MKENTSEEPKRYYFILFQMHWPTTFLITIFWSSLRSRSAKFLVYSNKENKIGTFAY